MFSRISMLRPALSLIFFCALVESTTSCGRFTKTKQCRALIAQVNPALDEVQTLTDAGAGAGGNSGTGGSAGANTNASGAHSSGARYIAAAARYERLAKDLGPLEFSSEQMAKNVAEYASVLTTTAQNLRALGAALDANNAPEIERVNRELEKLTVREHAAITRIDTWCAPEN